MKSLLAILVLALAGLLIDVLDTPAPEPPPPQAIALAAPTSLECGMVPAFAWWPEIRAWVSALLSGGGLTAEPFVMTIAPCGH